MLIDLCDREDSVLAGLRIYSCQPLTIRDDDEAGSEPDDAFMLTELLDRFQEASFPFGGESCVVDRLASVVSLGSVIFR